ncbi:MAG: alcohol dehydrogenase catalytic domain-containing protein [Armatimonadia bacterium]
MKALLTDNNGRLWLQDISRPTLTDYDCLVQIEACLFCHSTDRHLVSGKVMGPLHNPSILGHESLGVIVETGTRVRHRSCGDRVLRPQALYPGEVSEGIGSGWGGFAEFGKVRDVQAMVDDGVMKEEEVPLGFRYQALVPQDIPFEKSLLLITQKEIHSAAAKIEDVAGKRFVVAGAGITGCLFGLFLRWRGASQVTMVARREAPLAFALQHGCADDTMLLSDTAGKLEQYDGLVDTTGSMAVMEALADTALAESGTVYSYAVYEGMAQQGFYSGLAAKHSFLRIDPAEATAHEAALDMIRSGRFDPAPFVTGRFGLNEWEAAWRSVTEGTSLKTGIFFT